jgi:hypothetical protein
VKAKEPPFSMRTNLTPLLHASNSRENILVKSGRASTGIVHIVSFKDLKKWYIIGVQLKELVLRRVVRGVEIFHNFEQTYDNVLLNLGNHVEF